MKNVRLIPTQEIQSIILECTSKVWNHVEMRNVNQINDKFVLYMQETIEELNKVLEERKAS